MNKNTKQKLKKNDSNLRALLAQKTFQLKIETSLEKARSIAMKMKEPDDMLKICKTISQQLQSLGVKEIRNVQTAIFYESRGTYMNYEYYTRHHKPVITETVYTNNRIHKAFAQKMLKGKGQFYKTHIKGRKKVDDWIAYQKTTNVFIDKYLKTASSLNYYWFSLGPVALGISTYAPLSDNEKYLFKRFLKVFELSYRRYLDIEKAEAQAREANIEAAVERVRARTMAMHNSEELAEVISLLQKELTKLEFALNNCIFWIMKEEPPAATWWVAPVGNTRLPESYKVVFPKLPYFNAVLRAWKKRESKWVYELAGADKKITDKFIFNKTGLARIPPAAKKAFIASKKVHITFSFYNYGGLHISTTEPLTESQLDIINRFSKVFDQTYTRFLDLQKAEVQAKEGQIQLALERVRARTMAMQKSDELREVVGELFHQVQSLGIEIQMFVIFIFKPDGGMEWCGTEFSEKGLPQSYDIPPLTEFTSHSRARNLIEIKKYKPPYQVFELSGVEKKSWDQFLLERTGLKQLPAHIKKGMRSLGKIVLCDSVCDHGILEVAGPVALSGEHANILQRFTKVFEQTYTRFLDVQKAEAQAREGQIQLALERVRARTMAMHKSDELKEVIKTVLEQFVHLNINVGHAGFYIDYKANDDMHIWLADPNIEPFYATFPYFDTPTWNSFLEAKAKGTTLHTDLLDFEEKNKFYQSLFKLFTIPEEAKRFYLQCRGLAVSTVLLDNVGLYIENFDAVPYSDEENNTLIRIGKVFQQTYTRFLDLQKAEAQAREGQIQLALERVRARTMAMHKSDELPETSHILFEQMNELGEPAEQLSIGIVREELNVIEISATLHGDTLKKIYSHSIDEPYMMNKVYKAWKTQQKTLIVELKGEELNAYNHYRNELTHSEMFRTDLGDENRRIVYAAFFSKGMLALGTNESRPPQSLQLLQRFASVFDLTYTRFLDLQKAEEQTREAQIEAALERVRARAMAMHSSEELKDVAMELRHQMGQLGQKDLEVCAIHLYEEDKDYFESWGAMRPPGSEEEIYQGTSKFPKSGIKIVEEMLQMYASGMKDYVLVNEKEKALEWFEVLKKHKPEAYTSLMESLKNVPAEELRAWWSLSDFSGGALLMVTQSYPDESSRNLLRRSANVFDLAYRRFADLKKAEAQALQAQLDLIEIKNARKKAEEALSELQTTQKQLIQSEKMASLGELTAGIAHEIQNPLNFVNNFSEVSKELLDEMRESIEKGDTENAKEIMNDVIQNLEKINHHGKRADGIVKGMLQHSRSSSGQKELTDINVLVDEYLRLAYHGLRAKDKSFNAKFETGFDESIEKINIVPQDIGRVILNLINNAFYAVSEKQKACQAEPGQAGLKYEPTVTISTKKINNKVEISIKDNGNGIPYSIKEKIFQPFFTTKPTGQGTGLGLSLSYDIIKAHGGEIKVETKEGEGTVFCLQLPVND